MFVKALDTQRQGKDHATKAEYLETTDRHLLIGTPRASLVAKWKESEVAQSCPTLCDPMDGSPPGSSVHGIFQARILEWGAVHLLMQETQVRSLMWGDPTCRRATKPMCHTAELVL